MTKPTGLTGLMHATSRRLVRGFRVFSSGADAARVRRPTDVVLLILSVLGVLALAVVAPGPTTVDTAVTSVIDALRVSSGWLWDALYALLPLWLLVLIVFTAVRRPRVLIDYLVTAAIALALALVAGLAAGTAPSDSLSSLFTAGPPAIYVATRLAVGAAIIVTASPHLARPLRWVGRLIILVAGASAVVLGNCLPIGAVAGILVGIAAAAITHLIFGSPGGRPTPVTVDEALADLGIEAQDVAELGVELSGVAMFTANEPADETHPDRRLLIKVYGRDAWDGQLITSTWTALQNKGETPQIRAGRLERVEHEAVATLMAERGGVRVLPVVAVGRSADGDALLVTALDGSPLASSPAPGDDYLRDAWTQLVRLHGLGISHGDLDADCVIVRDDGTAAITDLSDAQVGAERSAMLADRARLLVALAIHAGKDSSVSAAEAVLGKDGLAELLPLLQPAVLDRGTRKRIDDGEWSLADLTTATVAAAGVEPPELMQLRRVTVKGVVMVALIGILAYYLITKLANVDLASIWDELKSANFAWLLGALLVSPLTQASYAIGTLGASMVPLQFVPVMMLQFAIGFVALVVPSTAAKLALEIRFFEKYGIPGGAAVSIGALDSFTGFLVQISLLILISVSGLPGFTSSLTGGSSSSSSSSTDTSSTPSLLGLCAALLVIGAILTFVIPKYRRRLFTAIPHWREEAKKHAAAARDVLKVVRRPGKVLQMLGGNLSSQVIQAIVLGMCLQAFGYDAHLSQLILINTFVSLFAGLMPVPGGMGVAEAGYTAGLQAIGIPSAVAISTAIAFRLVTFYLPPIWGSVAMKWMRNRDYL